MKKILFILLFILANLVGDNIYTPQESFSVLCIDDPHTKEHLEPNKYLVTKVFDQDKCKSNELRNNIDRNVIIQFLHGCYQIKLDDNSSDALTHKCSEEWKRKGEIFILYKVSCPAFNFQPNGDFDKREMILISVEENNISVKKTLNSSHGHCSLIKRKIK